METLTLRPNAPGDVCSAVALYIGDACPDHYKNVQVAGVGSIWYNWPYPQINDTLDAYNIEVHTTEVGVITNVRVYARLRDDAPNPDYRRAAHSIGVRIGGTTYYPLYDSPFKAAWDWAFYYKDWPINPATEAPWTWADIDALQITIGLTNPWRPQAGWSDMFSYVNQMWAEVEYSPPAIVGGLNPALVELLAGD